MNKSKETIRIFLALFILGIFLALIIWLVQQLIPGDSVTNDTNPSESTNSSNPTLVAERISFGERALVKPGIINNSNPKFQEEKQEGIDAFKNQDYSRAVDHLENALKAYQNAPETLIYKNNAQIAQQQAYTIAVVVPLESTPNQSLEILRGVAQAQNEINKQGKIKGIPLKVAIADDNGDPTTAKEIAETLINEHPEVLGVIGHFSSGVSLEAASVYKDKLVMISPTSTSVKLSGLNKYIFRTVPSDRFSAGALANYMLNNLDKRRAAVFYNSESAYSRSLKGEFITALIQGNGEVVGEVVDFSQPNFKSKARDYVKQAIDNQAEVLMLAPNSDTIEQALQVARINYEQLPLLAGDSPYSIDTLEEGREVEGMVLAVAWHRDGNPNSPFPQNSQQLWGANVSWRTAMAYDAGKVLIAALKQNPSRKGIQETLAAQSFSVEEGASGTIRFLPTSGDRQQRIQLVTIQPGNSGYNFIPLN